MAVNRGKQFEDVFRKDWKQSFPNTFLLRLPDQTSGFYGSRNLCDFIAYFDGILFLIECKSHSGASIPFSDISQYKILSSFVGFKGIRVGVVVWLYDKDMVLYVPVQTIVQMVKDGKKSVGVKSLQEGYNIKIVPSTKMKVFMKSDYRFIRDLQEGE